MERGILSRGEERTAGLARASAAVLVQRRRNVLARTLTIGGHLLALLVLVVGAVGFVFPLVWMISTSLKSESEVFAVPPIWIPATIRWDNYPAVFTYFPFWLYLRNTLLITVPSVLGTVISSALPAYGFSRIRWPGRDAVFALVLATLMIPGWTTLIPVYVLFARMHWVGTFLPLIVPNFFGSAFFIFLLRQFFLRQPQELVDAARIDGASHLGVFARIILPLSKPALAVVALFSFMANWTDFFGPLIFLNNADLYTLSIGLYSFQSQHQTDWTTLMAASLMVLSPMIILFFFTQRTFVEGITFTGLRG
ncbi:MAG: carbohydrate ABC transporter permease [Chloroflexi bacterium]|nr:carbohydrate ABC transporter permease [Chloroflexota bacterium]